MLSRKKGITLIEVLILTAISLFLIAIALPNLLGARLRADVTRVRADQRSLAIAIELFRQERGVLLIDFWDDGQPAAGDRWREKFYRVGRDPGKGSYRFFEEPFYPLTSPIAYIKEIAIDPFNAPGRNVGLAGETGLGYIYFDNDVLQPPFEMDDHGIDIYENGFYSPGERFGIKPLATGEFGLLSVGPDLEIGRSLSGGRGMRGLPYSATNGVKSRGDIVTRSGGKNL